MLSGLVPFGKIGGQLSPGSFTIISWESFFDAARFAEQSRRQEGAWFSLSPVLVQPIVMEVCL